MLAHLKQKIIEALGSVQTVTLATTGASGLQVSNCPCYAKGLQFYLVIPATSEHLVNLEDTSEPEVVITTPGWQLRGRAVIPANKLGLVGAGITGFSNLPSIVTVEILPVRFELLRAESYGGGVVETIDL